MSTHIVAHKNPGVVRAADALTFVGFQVACSPMCCEIRETVHEVVPTRIIPMLFGRIVSAIMVFLDSGLVSFC